MCKFKLAYECSAEIPSFIWPTSPQEDLMRFDLLTLCSEHTEWSWLGQYLWNWDVAHYTNRLTGGSQCLSIWSLKLMIRCEYWKWLFECVCRWSERKKKTTVKSFVRCVHMRSSSIWYKVCENEELFRFPLMIVRWLQLRWLFNVHLPYLNSIALHTVWMCIWAIWFASECALRACVLVCA